MERRNFYWTAGILFLIAGSFLPRDWYDAIPQSGRIPIDGATLFQFTLVLEAMALFWLGHMRWSFVRIAPAARLVPASAHPAEDRMRGRNALWLMTAITVLAAGLRIYRLDADLWIDEIATLVDYTHHTVFFLLTRFIEANNHLLNTLLIKLSIGIFGENEWSVRLPATLFGIASIPAVYWLARMALPRWMSICIALLLAVSYHHIFFSQNARGYSMYIFFSIVSTGLFIQGLREDRRTTWILYIITMFLNFAALLLSGFVFVAHILTGLIALIVIRFRGQSFMPMFWRLFGVFLLTGFLGFQLYSVIIPQVFDYLTQAYGIKPSRPVTVKESSFYLLVLEGIAKGFGSGVILGALTFLLISGIGFLLFLRRNWLLALTLFLPGMILAMYLFSKGMSGLPRLFIFELIIAIIAAVTGLFAAAKLLSSLLGRGHALEMQLGVLFVLMVAGASLYSLEHYYAIPKQNYRGPIAYLEQIRKPDDIVIALYTAELGIRYYSKEIDAQKGKDYFFVRSLKNLNEVLDTQKPEHTFLVTTLHEGFHSTLRLLYERIHRDWKVLKVFPGTVAGGEITVWGERESVPHDTRLLSEEPR